MSVNRKRVSADLDHTNAYSDHSDASADSDYNENERILLSKFKRNRKDCESDEDEAMFDVASDVNSDNDKSDIALSDIEDNADDDLPNARAWGRDKRSYYSTDYIDQDYGGHTGKDALNADIEEEEAQNLQLELAKQLEDEDFILDIARRSDAEWVADVNNIATSVKTDTTKLTRRQKIQLLEKESPEFFNLIADFNEKMTLVKDVLFPAIELFETGQTPKPEAVDFALIYKDLLLNYSTNIAMYLLLKSQRVKLQSHPIIKRLLQYRKLVNEMQAVYEKYVGQRLADLLKNNKMYTKPSKSDHVAVEKQKHKEAKKGNSSDKNVFNMETRDALVAYDKQVVDKAIEDNEPENEVEEKRAITYQMKKNKGLMPTRKKEQRNPRVKHRNKFRKAQLRRKGAVRQVRTELSRYGGEISGIKASVVKGIKIK